MTRATRAARRKNPAPQNRTVATGTGLLPVKGERWHADYHRPDNGVPERVEVTILKGPDTVVAGIVWRVKTDDGNPRWLMESRLVCKAKPAASGAGAKPKKKAKAPSKKDLLAEVEAEAARLNYDSDDVSSLITTLYSYSGKPKVKSLNKTEISNVLTNLKRLYPKKAPAPAPAPEAPYKPLVLGVPLVESELVYLKGKTLARFAKPSKKDTEGFFYVFSTKSGGGGYSKRGTRFAYADVTSRATQRDELDAGGASKPKAKAGKVLRMTPAGENPYFTSGDPWFGVPKAEWEANFDALDEQHQDWLLEACQKSDRLKSWRDQWHADDKAKGLLDDDDLDEDPGDKGDPEAPETCRSTEGCKGKGFYLQHLDLTPICLACVKKGVGQ
jgi:hypothetical protein